MKLSHRSHRETPFDRDPLPTALVRRPLGTKLWAVIRGALHAVEPYRAVCRKLSWEDNAVVLNGTVTAVSSVARLVIVGAGKAALPMAEAVIEQIPLPLAGGCLIVPHDQADEKKMGCIDVRGARHPVPDQCGVMATSRLLSLVDHSSPADLIVVVLSGGASALLVLPSPNISLKALQTTNQLLLGCGASIVEINMIRKHLSQIKGGQLAGRVAPSTSVGLVLSDVVGDPLDTIGSGPTAPDPSTFAQAWSVVQKFDLVEQIPASVRAHLLSGCNGDAVETPKPGAREFQWVYNAIVASNRDAARAAVAAAREMGFNSMLLSSFVEGEAREVARVAAALVKELSLSGGPLALPACLVWGGETTVTVRGRGRGGRNQEMALALAIALEGVDHWTAVALATDGRDGPTDASGAVVGADTLARAHARGLDPLLALRQNDSYSFFENLDALLRLGATKTNVGDLLMLFVVA